MTYEIFEGNIERLEKKLTHISNKCKKYGCDFHYKQVGETFKEVKDENGNKYTARFIVVDAEGTAVINDWQFVAEVEHTENGNIISGVQGIEVPERYYTSDPVCEHCKSNRRRKDTYIVMNTVTGEFKQVGKSCLKDFTNGLSAETVTKYMSWFDTLIEGEVPYEGSYGTKYINRDEYLVFVAETIRHFGYQKSSWSEPGTASMAMDFLNASHGKAFTQEHLRSLLEKMESVNFNPEHPETVQLVKDATAWVQEQDESSNYIHNLKTACSLEWVCYKNHGLLASLFPAYNNDLMKQRERQSRYNTEKDSVYVGKIKDRITIKVNSIKCITSWETDFGMTFLYKMIGTDGNVYTWKTGKNIDLEYNSISVIGTVKSHTEFNGIKQTELTRCKIAV